MDHKPVSRVSIMVVKSMVMVSPLIHSNVFMDTVMATKLVV